MLTKNESRVLSYLIIGCGVLVGLAITPNTSFDPVNVPKMTALVIFAFSVGAVLVYKIQSVFTGSNILFLIASTLFLLHLFLVFLLSNAPVNQQIYGTFGRNTGLLTYASFVIISIAAYVISSQDLARKIFFALLGTTSISLIYALLQTTGNDPIKWTNPYNPIVGFLGNPNFQSSFMAMGGVAFFSLVLTNKLHLKFRISSLVIVFILVILMIRSKSQQGVIAFVVGCLLVLFLLLLSSKKFSSAKYISAYIGFGIIAVILGILGSLKIGPLQFLYKDSVRQRGFYWDAAIQMMQSHKFFGVGLDSYGDWYFASRSARAVEISSLITSNSAHNIFLEFGAVGGIPLLIFYALIVISSGISIVRYIRQRNSFDYVFAGLFGAWLAFQAQSVISINQIGLAIWGWILMGLIAGYKKKTLEEEDKNSKSRQSQKLRKSEKAIVLPMMAGAVSSLFIAIPFFNADSNFRSSLASNDANVFIKAALREPQDLFRIREAAIGLSQSKLNSEALMLVDHIVEKNPRAWQAWLIKKELTIPTAPGYENIVDKIRELNPRVPIE